MARLPLTVIGALPPPVQGAAVVTAMISERLRARGPMRNIDTAPPGFARGLRYHARRLAQVLSAAWRLVADGFGDGVVYVSAAGSAAVVYDAIVCIVARAMGRRIFLHHHSFAYIDRRDRVRAAVFAMAGPRATHVCLCPRMADLFRAHYGANRRTLVVSNGAFYAPPPAPARTPRAGGLVVGHLSNLSRDKGLDLVIAAFDACGDAAARLVIGGAPTESEAADILAAAKTRLGARLDHRGHLDGDAKARFYADIDVFLFPTRYVNEAEPLCVVEALAAGVPVVAFGRGCIGHMIAEGAGEVVPVGNDFPAAASARIAALAAHPQAFAAARAAAVDAAQAAHAAALPQLEALLDELLPPDQRGSGGSRSPEGTGPAIGRRAGSA